MALNDNERVQEIFLMLGDRLAPVNKFWWYLLAIFLILAIPAYFFLKFTFVNLLYAGYSGPAIIHSDVAKQPLAIVESKIFELPNNTYSGYVKIRNTELEWGVASQNYSADFKTTGGTVVNHLDRSTFILPASDKLIVFPRFTSEEKPTELTFNLAETHFVRKPQTPLNFDVERVGIANNDEGLSASAAFKNLSPFTVRQVELPIAVFNNKSEIIAVNFTYINDVKSAETRTFTYSWPSKVLGALRAEVNPEINIFDRNIFAPEEGVSPF